MIKPSDIPNWRSLQALESTIDEAIKRRASSENRNIIIYIKNIPGWFEDGWIRLKPKYEQYWIVTNTRVYIEFTPIIDNIDMI